MDRKKHWEKIYANKSPFDVSWYQTEPTYSLRLVDAADLGQDAAIIDVGGGASVLVDRLCEQGFANVAHLDISARALEVARERLGDRAASVQWIEADVTEFEPPHRFDLWHDRAVFHFLTEADDRRKYVQVLKNSLKDGGQLILASFAVGGPTKCSGLDICQYDAARMQAELGSDFQLVEELAESHTTPSGSIQKFAYFRFVFRQA